MLLQEVIEMGFFDNFKAAMQRGVEAANANIVRQKAEQAARQNVRPAARPAPQRPAGARHQLPEGVVMASLMDMPPLQLGTNSNGQNVAVNISGAIHAKPMGVSSLDAAAQREEVKRIAAETIQRELTPKIDSMGDIKFLMLEANRLNKVVVAELNAHGYEAAFKMPLVVRPM